MLWQFITATVIDLNISFSDSVYDLINFNITIKIRINREFRVRSIGSNRKKKYELPILITICHTLGGVHSKCTGRCGFSSSDIFHIFPSLYYQIFSSTFLRWNSSSRKRLFSCLSFRDKSGVSYIYFLEGAWSFSQHFSIYSKILCFCWRLLSWTFKILGLSSSFLSRLVIFKISTSMMLAMSVT